MRKKLLTGVVAAGAAAAAVAVVPLTASASQQWGDWKDLPTQRPNWTCGPTDSQDDDKLVHWYSQNCLVKSGDYYQAALILRRSGVSWMNERWIQGTARLTWNGGEGTNVGMCLPTIWGQDEVMVCYSKTEKLVGAHNITSRGTAWRMSQQDDHDHMQTATKIGDPKPVTRP